MLHLFIKRQSPDHDPVVRGPVFPSMGFPEMLDDAGVTKKMGQ